MTQRKKQANARCGTAGVWDQASKERFSEITSGRSGGQQGLVDNLHRLIQRGITEVEESLLRLTHESIRARKEEQCPLRRWKARLPNGGHTRIWAKGLWALGGLTVSTVVGHSTGHRRCQEVGRGCGQTRGEWGVCAPALKLHCVWEGPRKKGQGLKPDHGKSGCPGL